MTAKKTPKNTKITETVKALTAQTVVNEIGNLQVTIQSTLANVAAEITGKLDQLHNTEATISEMESRLFELSQIEKEINSLEEAKLYRADEQEKYNRMISARNQEWIDEEAEKTKQRKRLEEEYAYEFALRKKKALDDFNAEVDAQKRAELCRVTALQDAWNARESALKSQENEYANMSKLVADIDNRIKTEVSKAEAIVSNSVKKQYEHQIQLMTKDMESEKKMSDSKIESLHIQVGQMHDQILELNKQLIAARNDAKEVTSQALQSASGRQVADALQRAMDSKDTGKTK